MEDNEFLLVYPNYLIGERAGDDTNYCGIETASGAKGLLLFTERLLAEQFLEAAGWDAEIVEFNTAAELGEQVADIQQSFDKVLVDFKHGARRVSAFEIAKFIRDL